MGGAMKYGWFLLLCCLCLPASAQKWAPNPLSSAGRGDWAQYAFSLRSPISRKIGSLRVTLVERTPNSFTVTEKLRRGHAVMTTEESTYGFSKNFVEQVTKIYGKSFTDFELAPKNGVQVKEGVNVQIGKSRLSCTEVRIRFTGKNQGLACWGELTYLLKSGIGALGIVHFRSTISYTTDAKRNFSLSQETTLVLTDWKKK